MFTATDEIGRVNSRTFAVDDVKPASQPIWTESLSGHFAKRMMRKVVAIPSEDRLVINSVREARIESGRRRREALNSLGMSFGEGNRRPMTRL